MNRNFTRELRRAENNGHMIVCSMQPHEDVPVEYKPRHKTDPHPWVLIGTSGRPAYRFSGRECHVVKIPHASESRDLAMGAGFEPSPTAD